MISMKHFITTICLAKNMSTTLYHNSENVDFLGTDREYSHPILIPIQNLAEKGEKIKVTVILTSKTSPFVKQNYEHFVGELNSLRDEIGFDYGEINVIEASYDESSAKHLRLFESIINSIGKDELLTADITFGNKPTSMALQLALTYSYLYGENTAVKTLVYGEFNHDTQCANIFDVSALFYINSVLGRLSSAHPSDPLAFIRPLLDDGEDGGSDE